MNQKKTILLTSATTFALGAIAAVVTIIVLMPGMMIVEKESPFDLEVTVARIETAIGDSGWVHSDTTNMNRSMEKHGVTFEPQVRVIKLCKPEYAEKVLESDRYLSCLMPCAIAVWEDDNGKVMVSKMNTGLMGTLFGGTVAEIMGKAVSVDEKLILDSALNSENT